MRLHRVIAAVFLGAALNAHADYKLVWSDEFDGPSIDTSNWNHETFPGVESGNDELEHYTGRPENSYIENGCLVIQAHREEYNGHHYTSARMQTKGKREFTYGKIEARIKLPSGQGIWPAFWMMPAASEYGGWAASGEIDIVEGTNRMDHVFGTIHFGGPWPHNVFQGARYDGPEHHPIGDFSADFHVYTLEWQPYEMRWYVDGNLYSVQHEWYTTTSEYPAPFDKAFYIILNVAVGGRLPGSPDESTTWPQRMVVDWVRVYQMDNQAPTLEVASPSADARVPADEPLRIEASVSDPDGEPVTLEIYNGETLLTTINNAPWHYAWDTGDGLYTLKLRAVDAHGYARTVQRDVIKGKGIPRTPYQEPANVPGTIEAENFDNGMPGDAFHDNDKINHGHEYRPNQPVDIQVCSEGGFNLGWVEDGEWLTYTVEVETSGRYIPAFRVASPDGAGRFRLEVEGGDATAPVSTPATGDWQKYATVTAEPLHLEQGRRVLRLVVVNGGTNITSFSLERAP